MNPRASRQNFQGDTRGLAEFLSQLFQGGIRTNADARASGGAHLSAPSRVPNSAIIPNGPGVGGTSGLPVGLAQNTVNPMDVLAAVQSQSSPGVDPMTVLAQTRAQAGGVPDVTPSTEVVPGAVRNNADFMQALQDDMTAKPKFTPKKKASRKPTPKRKVTTPTAPVKNEIQEAINKSAGVRPGPTHKDRLAMLNAGYGADEDFGITY